MKRLTVHAQAACMHVPRSVFARPSDGVEATQSDLGVARSQMFDGRHHQHGIVIRRNPDMVAVLRDRRAGPRDDAQAVGRHQEAEVGAARHHGLGHPDQPLHGRQGQSAIEAGPVGRRDLTCRQRA